LSAVTGLRICSHLYSLNVRLGARKALPQLITGNYYWNKILYRIPSSHEWRSAWPTPVGVRYVVVVGVLSIVYEAKSCLGLGDGSV